MALGQTFGAFFVLHSPASNLTWREQMKQFKCGTLVPGCQWHAEAEDTAELVRRAEAGDEVTVALLSDYLKSQEKTVWMLVAFSTKKTTDA